MLTNKLLEKFVRNHIMNCMLGKELICCTQFGFVDRRSTALQLLNVLHEWCEALENNNYIDCIYLDFRKAFDTVPHARLLYKLQCYGMDENLIVWIKDFLTGAICSSQRKKSSFKPVLSGIPQGSVIGPFLFLLFINDLSNYVKLKIYPFADDTKIFRKMSSRADYDILQSDIDALINWSNSWLLNFNLDKCVSM